MRALHALVRVGVRFCQARWSERADALVAVTELARARWRLHRMPAAQMVAIHEPEAPRAMPAQLAIALRVGTAINRASRYVPWRSDCLVQALAAQTWLKRNGVPATLHLGALRTAERECPNTHAWLMCGETVITGGDVAAFSPFVPIPNRAAMEGGENGRLSDLT